MNEAGMSEADGTALAVAEPAADSGGEAPAGLPEARQAGGWPEDWRQQLAGADGRRLATLSRFDSVAALADAYEAAQKKLGERAGVRRPGPGAAAAEIAAWRRELGVPATPEGYDIRLPDGRIAGDDDAPVLASFAAAMHEAGAPPEVVNRAAGWYFDRLEAIEADRADGDEAFRAAALERLQESWGPAFRRNVNAVRALFADAPEGSFDRLMGGRTADGRRIGDDPALLGWLAQIALALVPTATLLPGEAPGAGGEARIAAIEALMRQDGGKAYWGDAKLQAEYGALLAARERRR